MMKYRNSVKDNPPQMNTYSKCIVLGFMICISFYKNYTCSDRKADVDRL